MPREKFPVSIVAEALENAGGFYSQAAHLIERATGETCTAQTVSNYVKRHKSLQDLMVRLETFYVDLAESELMKLVKDGAFPAIKFYLENKGRERGYGKRLEVTGKDGGPIETEGTQKVKPDLSGFSKEEQDQLFELFAARAEREGSAASR